jgi:hypothetical protein
MLMRKHYFLVALAFTPALSGLFGQVKRVSVPIGDTLSKALAKGLIAGENARPFHIRVEVSEPENPQSPYQGAVEEWWVSSDQWRREVSTKDGMRQTIVVDQGDKSEKDEGDYFPVWMRNFVTALFDPVPNAKEWEAGGIMIEQMIMPGAKSDPCARTQAKIGTPPQESTVYYNVCFDSEGMLKFVGSPGYSMEFHEYQGFGQQKIARKLVDNPESGTTLEGKVAILEDMPTRARSGDLFVPSPPNDDRFRAVQVGAVTMGKLTAANPPVVWPTVRSGNLRGKVAIYISVDTKGQVREAWPINADNGVDDSLREQVRKWTTKPAVDATGKPVQVDGPISFAFETRLENPLPELSDEEIRRLATKSVEPAWPKSVHSGEVIEAEISVNEEGKLTGTAFHSKAPADAIMVVMNTMKQWTFQPLIRDGKPQYFHGTVKFIVR